MKIVKSGEVVFFFFFSGKILWKKAQPCDNWCEVMFQVERPKTRLENPEQKKKSKRKGMRKILKRL